MGELRLVEKGGSRDGPGCLFQTPAFFRLHAREAAHYFEWVHKGRVAACVHFTRGVDGLWRSPGRGTFAGYAMREDLRHEELFAFHSAVVARLADEGARQIEVLPAPMSHDPIAFANQVYMLRASGFRLTRCDLDQSLEVTAPPLAERMSYANLKRLRKCRREGLEAQLLPASALAAVYDTLAANRARKGRELSMSHAELQVMAREFPQAMLLFGCTDGERLAAAALCLRLSARVMHVFYWGDAPGYSAFSPVVMLAEAIYAHCQATGVGLLDLGTSTVDIEPDFGLLHFKHGLGFKESLKVRMQIDL